MSSPSDEISSPVQPLPNRTTASLSEAWLTLYMSSALRRKPLACISAILAEMRFGSHIPSSATAQSGTRAAIIERKCFFIVSLNVFLQI